jgi:hypothetical protein
MLFILVGIGTGAAWSGQQEEAAVNAQCAKHGMEGYREPWGRDRCIDKDGNLKAFSDVR